jgi:4-amino-4-deoxy-L-arabinose transferase-like glycosyltransferase
LTVFTTFAFGRALGGRKAGWVAAIVMAFSAYHIHYSRLASNQILDPFIGSLSLWLLWRAAVSPAENPWRELAWGVAGIVTGFGWYAYFGRVGSRFCWWRC